MNYKISTFVFLASFSLATSVFAQDQGDTGDTGVADDTGVEGALEDENDEDSDSGSDNKKKEPSEKVLNELDDSGESREKSEDDSEGELAEEPREDEDSEDLEIDEKKKIVLSDEQLGVIQEAFEQKGLEEDVFDQYNTRTNGFETAAMRGDLQAILIDFYETANTLQDLNFNDYGDSASYLDDVSQAVQGLESKESEFDALLAALRVRASLGDEHAQDLLEYYLTERRIIEARVSTVVEMLLVTRAMIDETFEVPAFNGEFKAYRVPGEMPVPAAQVADEEAKPVLDEELEIDSEEGEKDKSKDDSSERAE